jgi:hypothetical protein
LRLAEADKISTPALASSSASANPSGAPKQSTLLPYLQKIYQYVPVGTLLDWEKQVFQVFSGYGII